MVGFVLDHEIAIRLGVFIGVFASMAVWEVASPRRPLTAPKSMRWFNNILVTVLNAVAVRLVFPTAAVGAALLAGEKGWGALRMLGLPGWASGALTIIILDLAIYVQHVVFHRVPLLWRLHRMHHADLDIDVTTGVRFHTAEILLSMGLKMVLVLFIGPPAWSVAAFEVILNATAMFNHGNVAMAAGLDRVLRGFVVTPDMHRVHHSVVIRETNSNYGFNLPWWDRIFGTYKEQPDAGHLGMTIGLANYREAKYLPLHRMLAIPFDKKER